MLRSFFVAFQFLTAIPVRIKGEVDCKLFSDATVYFPVVGIILGLILSIVHRVSYALVSDSLACIISVVILILLTGGLHIDGFADTIDGFYAGRNKEEILKIMKDPHVGTMGVIAIVCLIMLKTGFIGLLDIPLRLNTLVIMPVLSRWSMVFAMFLFGYARDQGKAKKFFSGLNAVRLFLATLITIVFVILFMGSTGLLLMFAVLLATYSAGVIFKRKINGLTGDILGFINELNELIVLSTLYLNIFLISG
ncbi:adenosylcobinamide-GDP ribazoletransferase [Elusimicrobiota bacterium]